MKRIASGGLDNDTDSLSTNEHSSNESIHKYIKFSEEILEEHVKSRNISPVTAKGIF